MPQVRIAGIDPNLALAQPVAARGLCSDIRSLAPDLVVLAVKPQVGRLDLHRSGQVLMSCSVLFEGHGSIPPKADFCGADDKRCGRLLGATLPFQNRRIKNKTLATSSPSRRRSQDNHRLSLRYIFLPVRWHSPADAGRFRGSLPGRCWNPRPVSREDSL